LAAIGLGSTSPLLEATGPDWTPKFTTPTAEESSTPTKTATTQAKAAAKNSSSSSNSTSSSSSTPASSNGATSTTPTKTASTSTTSTNKPASTDKPADKPAPTPPPADKTADTAKPTTTAEKPGKPGTIDAITGIGNFKLGQNFSEFPPGLLQVVDPHARGVLLRVSPYGENYLVTDVKGATWGGIPISGIVLTFHAGVLIDIQVAFKAKRFDFYTADRAFKTKYGPNDPKTFPVETWKGQRVQMTLIFSDMRLTDPASLDAQSEGKIDLFDQARWDKFEAERNAELKEAVEKRYQAEAKTVEGNL
jgi:hypothetical protein